jgi:hypothetical protein
MGVLIPNLKHSLLDPAPEVRSAAAQAIGSIVRHNTTGVFSSYTTDLIPWLKERMMSKSSMVDRLGAAQGLAEVVAAFEAGTDIIMTQAIEFASDSTNDPVSTWVNIVSHSFFIGNARRLHPTFHLPPVYNGREICSVY